MEAMAPRIDGESRNAPTIVDFFIKTRHKNIFRPVGSLMGVVHGTVFVIDKQVKFSGQYKIVLNAPVVAVFV